MLESGDSWYDLMIKQAKLSNSKYERQAFSRKQFNDNRNYSW